jgi:radical SAM protein with 4Fe4S-binding SPASM domain
MKYYLSDKCELKLLEFPSVYNIYEDELYQLDKSAFNLLKKCSTNGCDVTNRDFLSYCLAEGILVEKRVDINRSKILQSPIPSLRYLELQITDKCNLRCKHCYIGKPKNIELSIDNIERLLEEFQDLQGLRLLITGGEPLMHRDFMKFNKILPQYRFRKILFTNGLLLNRSIIKELNVQEIQFSVDGMQKGHETIRGEGTFRKVISRIEDAMSSGFDVAIATMIHRENLDEFNDMERLFKSMGIKDWIVDVPSITGEFEKNKEFSVSPDIAGEYMNYGFGAGLHGGDEGFACGLHLVSVMADGSICKCAFYTNNKIGDISEGLKRNWEKIKPIRLEELECFTLCCKFIDVCRGGCRFRAMGEFKRDIYKCYSYGIID